MKGFQKNIPYTTFLVLFCWYVQIQGQSRLSFRPIEDGLFNPWISSITQDSSGFLWVGTQDGLHRFDGYRFQLLRNSPETDKVLPANWIRDIAIDGNRNYWIGTYGGGLTRFSPEKMHFENFDVDRPMGKLATQVAVLDTAQILVSTERGFQLYNQHSGEVRSLDIGQSSPFAVTEQGSLWLADDADIWHYETRTSLCTPLLTMGSIVRFLYDLPDIGLLIGLDRKLVLVRNGRVERELALKSPIIGMTSKASNGYFMATAKSLFKFDPKRFTLEPVPIDLDMARMQITTLFQDKQENLWIGTEKGLYRQNKFNKAFSQSGINRHARRIARYKGSVYFGGKEGLWKMGDEGSLIPIKDLNITGLKADDSILMAAGETGEIFVFQDDKLHRILTIPSKTGKEATIYGLAKDKKGRVWAGSWEGLHAFDRKGNYLGFLPLNTSSEDKTAKLINIHIDTDDRLWAISVGHGIYRVDGISQREMPQNSHEIRNYRHYEDDETSLTSNIVTTLFEDADGRMWFGTDIGAVVYREKEADFQRLRIQGNLFDRKVMTIRQDARNYLWVTTINNGIYVYDGKAELVRQFAKGDGLLSDAFLFGSGYYDGVNRILYFGTDEGVQVIDASLPFPKKFAKAPIIESFLVKDPLGQTSVSPFQAPFLQNLSLSSTQNDFSVTFSALNLSSPEKMDYLYTLDDNPWKKTDLQTAYFTNVSYGAHELKVRSVMDGIISDAETTSLPIFIAPPWYLGRPAKMLYVALLFFMGWWIYRYLKWRWKIKFTLGMREAEAQRLRTMNDLKAKLYTDIAHEFKTPLTLMAAPVEKVLTSGTLTDGNYQDLTLVQRNTDRLTVLVDQLLQLAKLESGQLELRMGMGDLGGFLKLISQSFAYQAPLKHIRYTAEIGAIGQAWYDEDILEKIIGNLLTNAIKYCPEYGECSFVAGLNQGHLECTVANTLYKKANIDPKRIFDRYYQQDNHAEGMGVGLALVKELVKLYGGSIGVDLQDGSSIRFAMRLPVQSAYTVETLPQAPRTAEPREVAKNLEVTQDCPLVLVVEDHPEIRRFVRQCLSPEYEVMEARNGEEAIKVAMDRVPDIIISDVRMPVMDGVALTKIVKADEKTSHIPIILVTANTGTQNEIKGLASGADDFIVKPFKVEILRERVANLIANRARLRQSFQKEYVLRPKHIAITPADERFLEKVQKVLDTHLDNPEFNANAFSQCVGMSRMQLHRKLNHYTGMNTSEFMRSQRLKRAEQLLRESDLTINEIAYASGFNTATYFMKCFKAAYAKTPSEYMESAGVG